MRLHVPHDVQTGTTEDVAKYSKRTVRVTKEHNDDCKRLLKLMGVPIIEARSRTVCFDHHRRRPWSPPYS